MTKEIEIVSENNLPMISDDSLLALADRAEKQIEAIKKIKSIVLRVTGSHDWLDQQGKPYLAVSGAEKVARIFGISWRIDEPSFEIEPDGHFAYCYKGYFTLGAATIEAIGTRSSKDGFFKRFSYSEGGEKALLPPSEIDKGDVKKSAFTNLIGNGITRLLGIRNLEWSELEAAGLKRDSMSKVSYNNNAGDATSAFSAKRQEHHKKIEESLKIIYGDDKEAMKAKLIELTTWSKDGKEIKGTPNYLNMKQDKSVEILCNKLTKMAESLKNAPEVCCNCYKPIADCECQNG